jgi:hypothetical protein
MPEVSDPVSHILIHFGFFGLPMAVGKMLQNGRNMELASLVLNISLSILTF